MIHFFLFGPLILTIPAILLWVWSKMQQANILTLSCQRSAALADDNESWGWVIFWFVATPIVGAAFPPLGLVSISLALYYGGKRLFKQSVNRICKGCQEFQQITDGGELK